jgi:metal-responsive CopG/Arc/MetJ family transcriptional regulator
MKTAISLPDPLFRAADALSTRLGISRSELFQRAMERYLREFDDQLVTDALNRLYATESSALDAVLGDLQTASLPPDEH